MKQVSYKTHGLGVSGVGFEKHKAIWPGVHQFAGLFERAGMLELGRDQTSVALQHIADEKEIFLMIPDQENP